MSFAGELMPCRGVVSALWTPVEVQSAAASNAGDEDILELGEPHWTLDVEVTPPSRDDFDTWSAFIARRMGAAVTFTAYRTFRRLPKDPSIVSDAGLVLDSVDPFNSQVRFTGVAAEDNFNVGDMLSYRTANDGYYIGQVTEFERSQGGLEPVKVWPRPIPPHATTPAPRRIDALGEFRLTGSPRVRERHKRWSVQFSARQVIR